MKYVFRVLAESTTTVFSRELLIIAPTWQLALDATREAVDAMDDEEEKWALRSITRIGQVKAEK